MDTKRSKCVHLVEGGTNGSQDVNMAPRGKTSLGRVIHARKRQKTSFTNLETHGDRSAYLACDTCSNGVPNEIVPAGIVPIGNILVGNNIGFQTRTKGRANEDKRNCESRLAVVTKERDRLATKVKTLERDVATSRRAKPAAQPAEAVERAEGAETPAPPGDKGGATAAGVRYLLAGAQPWHAQAEACAGQMSAVSTGLRMAIMASGKQVDVDSVAPDAPKVTAAMEEVRRQYPPPTASRRRPWTPPLWRRWTSRAPRAPLAGALLPGGGGCRYPPEHLSFLTTTNVILPPPPQAWAV